MSKPNKENLQFLYDLLTTDDTETTRLKVDPQQSSFEANKQWKFYDDCTGDDGIDDTDVLIYRFTSTNAAKIQLRLINGIGGARKYTVYPYTGDEAITGGAWTDVTLAKVSPINNDLSVSGLSVHPISGVTLEKRIATVFTTAAPKRTGTAYIASSTGNTSVSSYTASGNSTGLAAGDSFLLVFENINGNDLSEFLFQLEWEEN